MSIMLNSTLVANAVSKKISDELFMDIVYEAFINGLPLNKDTMSDEDVRGLKTYTWKVTQAIGGIGALESAVDFNQKTPAQNFYLGQIYAVCNEGALVARKSAKDDAEKNQNIDLKTAVDRTALTEKEYNTFVKNKGNLNLNKVSDIIKKKTIAVIKDEQEQYDKEKELDEQLDEALNEGKKDMEEEARQNPTPDSTEDQNEVSTDEVKDVEDAASEAVTRLMNISLEKRSPRHHVSVFSRIQDNAIELINNMKVANEGDYFTILDAVTFNSFLPSIGYATEGYHKIANEEICDVPVQQKASMTNLVSIIVYTMMETLKTMGIISPAVAGIKNFVNTPLNTEDQIVKEAAGICANVDSILKEATMTDFSKMDSRDLTNKVVEIQNAAEAMESSVTINDTDMINRKISLNALTNNINDILNQRVLDSHNIAEESFNTKRQKSADVAQFDRINGMYGKNKLIDGIILKVNPEMPSIIDVECVTEGGNTIKRSYMNMQYACEASKYTDYLQEAFQKSNMKDTDKKVTIYINDGRGKRIGCNY